MDLAERISRRRVSSTTEDIVANWEKLDPTIHLDEPVGRGSVLEQILDTLETLFNGELPPNLVVRGPAGVGKSAIVISLLSKLADELAESRSRRYTATRGGKRRDRIRFAYTDARHASSLHKLYHSVLEYLTNEPVPERGIGTDDLRERIESELTGTPGAVIAIDHADEGDMIDAATLKRLDEEFGNASLITIGRSDPQLITPGQMAAQIEVPAYRTHELIDLLTVRASHGLTSGITHAQARTITSWAEGDAHDALVALFTAAMSASESGHAQLRDADIKIGIDRSPLDGVSLGRVLTLSENKQVVLERLFDVPEEQRVSIETTAETIAANSALTKTTVRRFLYELADENVLKKVRAETAPGNNGRRPTRLEPLFPVAVFKQLRSLRQ
ncbi:Cdc6/Cdc18 family protein (plasmid) [Haloarcula sp. NS06]|uniref:Cdc6/Cdc18 family protein n=1 Tax=Haloarcula sp. NS06 TaxID=3409688 RepID=UPI003DA706B9